MKSILRILIFAKSLWRYYIVIAVLAIAIAALEQLPPLLVRTATDQIVNEIGGGEANRNIVILAIVGIFAAGISVTLLSNLNGYFGDIMAAKLRKILSERYFEHLLKLPQKYFDNELTGTIINRLNRSISDITQFMNIFTNNFASWLLQSVLIIAIVSYFSWQLGLLIFIIYPIFLFMTIKTSQKWIKYQDKKNYHNDVASGRFAEAVSQVRVVKSFLRERGEQRFFKGHFAEFVKQSKPQSKIWHKQDILRRSVLEVIFFGIMFYIIYGTYNGQFTIGEMFMLIQYSIAIRFPILSMSFIVDNTQRAISGSRDYFKAMSEEPQHDDPSGAKTLKVGKGEIEFANVDFAYESKKQVLHDITFTINPHSKVAFVGESGGGKTTLTSLLMRLYDIDKGSISIDGQRVSSVTQQSLRKNIGVVFQEPALFSGTVRENISYANPKASLKAVETAAKAANAHEFIKKLSDGYDTLIGERGTKLSGGQKQRIAIARAILKDAPILILDEATSALDSRSEHLVHEALERLMKNRTTIIIAHRLSTIASVDKVITLKDGSIDEIGSPKELAQSGGIYGQLLRLQGESIERQKKELKKFDISPE